MPYFSLAYKADAEPTGPCHLSLQEVWRLVNCHFTASKHGISDHTTGWRQRMQNSRHTQQSCSEHWQIGTVACARWHASCRIALQRLAQQPAICMQRQGPRPAPQRSQPYQVLPCLQQRRHQRQHSGPQLAAEHLTFRRLLHPLLLLLLSHSRHPWCSLAVL